MRPGLGTRKPASLRASPRRCQRLASAQSGSETLVFLRVVGETERLSQIAVIANSLARNGATIVSKSMEAEAALGQPGTQATFDAMVARKGFTGANTEFTCQ